MVLLIVVITSIALISVMTGINVGIKRLSQFNIILAFLLLLTIILLGPTLYIFRTLFTGLGTYIMRLYRSATGSGARIPTSCTVGQLSTGHGGSLGHPSLGPSLLGFQRDAPFASLFSLFSFYRPSYVNLV